MFPKISISRVISVLFIVMMLIGSTAFPTSVRADSIITVNSFDDNIAVNGFCTLREAITNANNNAATYGDCTAGSGNDSIIFASSLNFSTITLTSTLPAITDGGGLIIDGNNLITLSGNDSVQVFYVNSGALLTLQNISVTHGKTAYGGGLRNEGTVNLISSTFSNNSADNDGGGVHNIGTLTVTNSAFSNNNVTGLGGGVTNYGMLTITNSTFSNNNAIIDGGGLVNNSGTVAILTSNFVDNSATGLGSRGGGMVNFNGTLTITNSSVLNNSASTGGGLMNQSGTATVLTSTFYGNSAINDGGGSTTLAGTLTIANSTFSNNSASFGGGLMNNSGTATILNSTFSGNSATGSLGGGGVATWNSSTTPTNTIRNTILANSTAGGDCFNHIAGSAVLIGGNNIIEMTSSCTSIATITSDPNLGSLTGSPAYFALNAGSPAIDAGDDATCAAAPVSNTSQNGITRPQGAHCDIGAFEVPPPTTLVNSVLPTSRSIPVGTLATIFNTVINAGANTAYGITLSMNPAPAGTFAYQQTNCATNAIIGSPNPSLDLAPSGVLCYVLSFTPSATFAAASVHIQAQASNAPSTTLLTGINTWLLRSTSIAGPDIIALTTTTDFHQVACSGANAFAVALSNVGAAAIGDITAVANTGSVSLPLSISISETNPATGVVIGDHILQTVGAGENRTVAVFVTFNGCIAFDPAANRIFIEFRDASNNVVGSTSTAVSTGR